MSRLSDWNRIELMLSGPGQEYSHECTSHASWAAIDGRPAAA